MKRLHDAYLELAQMEGVPLKQERNALPSLYRFERIPSPVVAIGLGILVFVGSFWWLQVHQQSEARKVEEKLKTLTTALSTVVATMKDQTPEPSPVQSADDTLSLMSEATTAASGDDTHKGIGSVTAQRAAIRRTVGREGEVMLTISRGTRLLIVGRKDAWFRVLTPQGTPGWISKDVFRPESAREDT